MSDLQELFARLQNSQNQKSDGSSQQPQSPTPPSYHQPSISSPIYSPAPSGPQPHHSSAILSPNTSSMNTPAPESGTRATDLLSLLKFRQGSAPAQSAGSQSAGSQSAADLVAGFTRKPSNLGPTHSPSALAPASSRPELRGEASNSSANPQDFLLKLLNQAPKLSETASFTSSIKSHDQPLESVERVPLATLDGQAQETEESGIESFTTSTSRAREASPMVVFGNDSTPPTSFDAPKPAAQNKIFTYINPFEQLAASSPRNRTPKPESRSGSGTPQVEVMKHARDTSTASAPAAKSRKVSADPPTTAPFSPSGPIETVSEAVSGVDEVVDKQVELALAQITSKANGNSEPKVSEAEKAVQEAAADIKKDMKDDKTRKEMEAGMTTPMAEAFEATINAVAEPDEDWEEAAEKDVCVFQFPMQPFVSITIKQLDEPPLNVPLDALQDIAKMKKEFDQIDRNLVTASQQFMVYPLKNGGLRVIRQEDGSHKQIFASVKERMFNVSLSSSKKAPGTKETETVLATGVGGSIFWAPLANFAQDELFGQTEEERGFLFPPVPTSDENTSGGQLKTRVKPSSRNPDFFAYGRGKSIYLISPNIARTSAYCDTETRICNSDKYLKENTLKISTGKAGKDFVFSADDTVIVSLDKVGRLKFWDIRPLTQTGSRERSSTLTATPVDVKVPLMTLTTCQPTEKSWPTSVMLLDKDKPMSKGIALRYVIIGMKQNHSLQIWDLTLGKPVQEVNFPHEQESDGICSLAYHPKSGILVVGHPTRNSIYFMNISAPQYNLPPMSQAKFVNMLANKDANLPTPQSTIIASGIREFSLGPKVNLRSLDMLSDPGEHYGEDAPLFVLYIMHSKGISEMRVTRPLLGWSEAGKYINQVNAVKVGAVTISDIKPLPAPTPGENASVVSEPPPAPSSVVTPSKVSSKDGSKKTDATPARQSKVQAVEAPKAEQATNGDAKKKKKEKKVSETVSHPASTAPSPYVQPVEVLSRQIEQAAPPSPAPKAMSVSKASESEATQTWATIASSAQEIVPASTASVVDMSGIEAMIKGEFESLAQNLAQDRHQQEASAATRQEGVLKVVSRTLHENVEDSLSRVVTDGLNKITLSPLKEVVASNIDRNLSNAFHQALKASVPRELEKALPGAVSQVLQDQKLLRTVADTVSRNVAHQVDQQFAAAMRDTIAPSMANLAISAAKQMTGEVERRFIEQIQNAETQHQRDNAKIADLIKVVSSLQQTVHAMAEDQVTFQQQTAAVLNQLRTRPQSRAIGSVPQTPSSHQQRKKSPEELEREEIESLIPEDLVTATIKWMHSARKIELFDEVFVQINPGYLSSMSALVALSVAAAVTDSLENNILQRLAWLELGLHIINPSAPEIEDVFPKVLEVIQTRLQQAYMQISENNHADPILKNLASLSRRVQDMKSVLSQPSGRFIQ